MTCYDIETHHFKDVLFKSLDATFVISLESYSDRREKIKKMMFKHKFTKVVHILKNKGYKNCNKVNNCGDSSKPITNSVQDITHAHREVINTAKKMGYKNILILEDDAVIIEYYNLKSHVDNITKYITTKKPQLYLLFYMFPQPHGISYHKPATGQISPSVAMIVDVDHYNNIFNSSWECSFKYPHVDALGYSMAPKKYYYYLPIFHTTVDNTTENFNFWCENGEINKDVVKSCKQFNNSNIAKIGFSLNNNVYFSIILNYVIHYFLLFLLIFLFILYRCGAFNVIINKFCKCKKQKKGIRKMLKHLKK
tara:strand:- start:5190 stop:6116 length:927 start_codon:yes stop_codon:yes gene_type:complete